MSSFDPNVLKAGDMELHGLLGVPVIQVDGLSQLLIGAPMVKLVFHQVLSPADSSQERPELRKAAVILNMSAAEAVQLGKSIIDAVSESYEEVEKLQHRNIDRLKRLLDIPAPEKS